MKKKCKTKQYFDGGEVLNGFGNTINNASGVIGSANSGNVGGLISSGINMNLDKMKQMQKLAELSKTKKLSTGQMLGSGLATASGLGDILNPIILGNLEDPFQDSQAIDQRNQMFGLANGGMLNYYNGGFKHNDSDPDNEFNGIPQGMTPDGNLNTVEKDETRWQDFIFSDKLKVDKNIAKEFNLPNSSIGKTFAQVSKTIDKELIERPNDKITKTGVERNMTNLMMANNAVKIVDEDNFASGGKLNFSSPKAYKAWLAYGHASGEFAKTPGHQKVSIDGKAHNVKHETNPWLVNKFSTISSDPYNRENVTYPSVQGMPPFGAVSPTGSTGKRWSVEDIYKYATTPEDRRAALVNFSRRPAGEWGYYANQEGQEIGANNVPTQNINGRFAGGVTSEELKLLYPNIINKIAPNGNFTGSDEQLDAFQKEYAFANKMELDPNNPTYGKIGGDWLRGTDLETPPPPNTPDLLPLMKSRTTGIKGGLDTSLMPIPEKRLNTGEPGTPPVDVPVPNLWPEAGMLSAVPYMGLKPVLANPTTMSTGYLKPQLVDEMSMRAGIDAANRANVGALANVTGGSAAAQRAGLMGAGANYMGATSDAFLQGNLANNQARMAADQFNIQNQTGVAGQNMGALNQFELENKELINNINAKKADEFANTWSNYVENASKRRSTRELEEARRRDIKAFTGYDVGPTGTFMNIAPGTQGIPEHQLTWEEWNKSKNPAKLAENTSFCKGGALKTMRRSLK